MNKKLFLLILVLAFVLRFWQLGQIPLTLDWDEVSNAYNAYSILKTGRDEYNKFLPFYNRSFDDFKPPAYMYLNIPSIAIFGLNAFAARLPSAFFGFLTIPALYFLTKRLLNDEKVALISAFLLAISPWHLQFSRVGFEANVGLAMAVFAFTFLIYAQDSKIPQIQRRKIFLIIAGILLGLTFYTYHSMRIFVPLLFLITLAIFKDQLAKFPKKYLVSGLIILILIIAPIFIFTPREAIAQRYETTTQSARLADINKSIEFILEDQKIGFKLGNLVHNRRFVIAQTFMRNYLAHFDLNFLFTSGDNNFRHHVQNLGMLYLFELPLIVFGLFLFVRKLNKEKLFVLSWLLLAPIPASLGDAVPHAVRSQSLLIPLQIIAAYAMINIYNLIKLKKFFVVLSMLIIFISVFAYLHNYYYHYPYDYASWWQYGYDKAAKDSVKLADSYDKIIIDPSIEQAYIFWLFNLKFNPNNYQQRGSKQQFDKFYFMDTKPQNSKELLISASLPDSYESIETIYGSDGKEVIKIGHSK